MVLLRGVLSWASVVWLIFSVSGCTGKPPTPGTGSNTSVGGSAATTSDALVTSAADDMLTSAVFQLQPENLGIDADVSSAAAVLRNWREQSPLFSSELPGFTEAALKSIPGGWLTDTQRKDILSQEFMPADALFIRNALLTSTMARYAAGDGQAELDRVVNLFDFTMRTVSLQPPNLPQLPFPLYEIILTGQGTPDDRAWVFAALLKQQGIDTVILQSKDDSEAKLVGVVLDGEVYLFDARLGVPIPRGDDPPAARIARPATLKEMVEHPDWWQALTIRADQPYPWSSEQLRSADVFAYSAPESWSTRMRQLQSVLPSSSQCVLYDPLGEAVTEGVSIEPLPARIAKGNPEWTSDKLKFWNHPLNLVERAKSLGQQVQQLVVMFERFKLPFEVKVDEQKKVASIKPTLQHMKCRTEQLQGKFKEATNHFLAIRHLAVENLPRELAGDPQRAQQLRQFYAWAASDASFWSAACKFEQGDYQAAATALHDYQERFARIGGDWISAAKYLEALALARTGKFDEAKKVVNSLGPDDPHRAGLEVLMKRWPASEQKAPEKTDSDEKKPDSDAPADASKAE